MFFAGENSFLSWSRILTASAVGLRRSRLPDVFSFDVVVAEYFYDRGWNLRIGTCGAALRSAARRKGKGVRSDAEAAEGVGLGVYPEVFALVAVLG